MTLIWAILRRGPERGNANMSKIDLSKYGINDVKEIIYNPSYEFLYEEEMRLLMEAQTNEILQNR